MTTNHQYLAAIQDFRRMRRRVALQRVLGLVTKPSGLLSYQEVRTQLHAIEKSHTKLREIPIDAIRGSVGRYTDFTRDFLPTDNVDEQRWARVKTQFISQEGVPPIDVYQIGEVYFVLDGNHRVSVARQMGNETIDAYVREVKTKVPLKLDENVDQLLIKTELTEFLEQTRFNQLFPDELLTITVPGSYTIIQQQIEAIHFAFEFDENRVIPYNQAVKRWYDNVYYPIIEVIRDQNILQEYPERTETDLFLWVFKHRAALIESLGWEITPDNVVKDLTNQTGSRMAILREKSQLMIQKFFHPRQAPSGPPPGTWRQEKARIPKGRLFDNVLVVIDGTHSGWQALSQALYVAVLEGSQLFGLHISHNVDQVLSEQENNIQAEFEKRCQQNKVPGQIAFEVGSPKQIILERANWVDLVIMPGTGQIGEEIHPLARECPIPIMVIKEGLPKIKQILLAYDGSPKSDEALFVAAYMVAFWELNLTVLTIPECEHAQITPETISNAKAFLDYYGILAKFSECDGEPASGIQTFAKEQASDLIIFGDYCPHPRNKVHRTTLDELLANSQQPILICR
jgi:nucleotide-binding universal stress UspA family protein